MTGRVLTAPRIDPHNTFEEPDAVKPAPLDGCRIHDDVVSFTLPAKSVAVVEIG